MDALIAPLGCVVPVRNAGIATQMIPGSFS
jgi:hypothetical protein